jgi:hypothetical protein
MKIQGKELKARALTWSEREMLIKAGYIVQSKKMIN